MAMIIACWAPHPLGLGLSWEAEIKGLYHFTGRETCFIVRLENLPEVTSQPGLALAFWARLGSGNYGKISLEVEEEHCSLCPQSCWNLGIWREGRG